MMASLVEWGSNTPAFSIKTVTIVSSVDGFSQPAIESIRTFQDLLRSLSQLKLQRYEEAQLQESELLGEGASYKVYKAKHTKTGSVVAVKKIKLPSTLASQSPFKGLTGCMMRDIEAMSHRPLSNHPNILTLLGYGWEPKGVGLLPFIVTEYASLGTLREYLLRNRNGFKQKRELFFNVVCGLNELHLSGIAHGDMKLENVLVDLAEPDYARNKGVSVVAKLSDFAHSLRCLPETNSNQQTYHGTLWYNPPEVIHHRATSVYICPRKCDVWALGLLCWEIYRDGVRYYKNSHIERLLSNPESEGLWSNSGDGDSLDLDQASSKTLCEQLFDISHCIIMEAQSWISHLSNHDSTWQHLDSILLKEVFERTLQTDLSKRLENVARLLSVYGQSNMQGASHLIEQEVEEVEWSFTLYLEEETSQIPMRVRTEMLSEFERLACLPSNHCQISGRAALHVLFACASNFTSKIRTAEDIRIWIDKSIRGGSRIALNIKDVLEEALCDQLPVSPRQMSYNNALRLTINNLALSELSQLDRIDSTSTFASLLDSLKALNRDDLATQYAVLYNLTTNIPKNRVNDQNRLTKETALSFACRLGDRKAVEILLSLGADASICAIDGSSPLHWLFAFEDVDMSRVGARLHYFNAVNRAAKRSQILDPQLPADLHGTPLAFAVAAASSSAVHILLNLDQHVQSLSIDRSLVLPNTSISRNTMREAWKLASGLYLEQILVLLYEASSLDASTFIDFGDLARTSSTVKRLIHGSKLELARAATVNILIYILGLQDVTWRSVDTLGNQATSGLLTAIQMGNLGLAEQIIESLFRDENYPHQIEERIGLTISKSCAEAACGPIFDIDTSFKMLQFSVEYGARLGYEQVWITSIIIAIEQHREDIFRWLMEDPQDLNSRNNEGKSILCTLLKSHFTAQVPLHQVLIKGADPNICDEHNVNPIHVALELHVVQGFCDLLAYGANLFTRDQSDNTLLHVAIMQHMSDTVSQLLQYTIGTGLIDAKNKAGRTPLALAASLGLPKMADLLLTMGANQYLSDKDQRSPLHLAALGNTLGHEQILSMLLVRQKGINSIDCNGNTSLHLAIISQARRKHKASTVFKQLLAAGADPNIEDSQGNSPIFLILHHLEKSSVSRLLPELVRWGGNVDARNSSFLSPLHIASLVGDLGLVRILIANGASLNLPGNEDFGTPLHCCTEIFEPGSASGSNAALGTYDWKVFSGLGEKGVITQTLIDNGADPLARFTNTAKGLALATPLDAALTTGNIIVAEVLIRKHHERFHEITDYVRFELLQRALNYSERHERMYLVEIYLDTRRNMDVELLAYPRGMKILMQVTGLDDKWITKCLGDPRYTSSLGFIHHTHKKSYLGDWEKPFADRMEHQKDNSFWKDPEKTPALLRAATSYYKATNPSMEAGNYGERGLHEGSAVLGGHDISIGPNIEHLISGTQVHELIQESHSNGPQILPDTMPYRVDLESLVHAIETPLASRLIRPNPKSKAVYSHVDKNKRWYGAVLQK